MLVLSQNINLLGLTLALSYYLLAFKQAEQNKVTRIKKYEYAYGYYHEGLFTNY